LKIQTLVTLPLLEQPEVLRVRVEFVIQLAVPLEFVRLLTPVETPFSKQAKAVMMEIQPAVMIAHLHV
jgi:hypothetical protein